MALHFEASGAPLLLIAFALLGVGTIVVALLRSCCQLLQWFRVTQLADHEEPDGAKDDTNLEINELPHRPPAARLAAPAAERHEEPIAGAGAIDAHTHEEPQPPTVSTFRLEPAGTLGFALDFHPHSGVFVSDVQAGSAADLAHLPVGGLLLLVNGNDTSIASGHDASSCARLLRHTPRPLILTVLTQREAAGMVASPLEGLRPDLRSTARAPAAEGDDDGVVTAWDPNEMDKRWVTFWLGMPQWFDCSECPRNISGRSPLVWDVERSIERLYGFTKSKDARLFHKIKSAYSILKGSQESFSIGRVRPPCAVTVQRVRRPLARVSHLALWQLCLRSRRAE
jgi:hypothetical protein